MTRERLSCKRCEVLLESYLDGELDGRRTARVESHLGGCFACQQELELAGSRIPRPPFHGSVGLRPVGDVQRRAYGVAAIRALQRAAPGRA